jgi:hypothetical protein
MPWAGFQVRFCFLRRLFDACALVPIASRARNAGSEPFLVGQRHRARTVSASPVLEVTGLQDNLKVPWTLT